MYVYYTNNGRLAVARELTSTDRFHHLTVVAFCFPSVWSSFLLVFQFCLLLITLYAQEVNALCGQVVVMSDFATLDLTARHRSEAGGLRTLLCSNTNSNYCTPEFIKQSCLLCSTRSGRQNELANKVFLPRVDRMKLVNAVFCLSTIVQCHSVVAKKQLDQLQSY